MAYYNISRNEMASFLEGQGFVPLALAGVVELVWRKRINHNGMSLSLWIFTGINPDGRSRAKGTDAIRLQMMYWNGQEAVRVGGSRRVHRVDGWKHNLQARIDAWQEMMGPACPCCGSPTVLREPKKGQNWTAFFGCIRFKEGCKGVVREETPVPKVIRPRRDDRRFQSPVTPPYHLHGELADLEERDFEAEAEIYGIESGQR